MSLYLFTPTLKCVTKHLLNVYILFIKWGVNIPDALMSEQHFTVEVGQGGISFKYYTDR